MIRLAQPPDLSAIVAIYNAAIPSRLATADTEPISVESRLPWLRDREPRHPVWVFEREGVVLAWLSLSKFYGRPAYAATAELGFYVAPSARRAGLATALLRHACAEAPALGHKTLLAFVFSHNVASIALCEKFGFSTWGTLPRVALLDDVERDLSILGLRLTRAA
jgi:L-amino acid N-acyltransferase YncA